MSQSVVNLIPTQPSGWLYNNHFGLNEAPFSLTPDTRFYFPHSSSQVALNTLAVAIRSGEGFTKITGEVGTGKTLLCRLLLDLLREDHILAYIPNPYLEPMTLLLAIADEMGIPYSENISQHQLLKTLTQYIIEGYRWDKRTVVVCLDEAHAIPTETLEALRLLSNLETQQHKLIHLVLFGQPELDEKLNQPNLRQLKQRISFSCTLDPIQDDDIRQYLEHRLQKAGYQGKLPFSSQAIKLLGRASCGTLRLVNILAHKAMISAYGSGSMKVKGKHVKLAIADTEALQNNGSNASLSSLMGTILTSVGSHLQRGQQ